MESQQYTANLVFDTQCFIYAVCFVDIVRAIESIGLQKGNHQTAKELNENHLFCAGLFSAHFLKLFCFFLSVRCMLFWFCMFFFLPQCTLFRYVLKERTISIVSVLMSFNFSQAELRPKKTMSN